MLVVSVVSIVQWMSLTLGGGGALTTQVCATLHDPVHGIVADSDSSARLDSALTEEQLLRFIAVKKATMAYWKDPAHASLLELAQSTAIRHVAHVAAGARLTQVIFDYPLLIIEDSVLAAIFTANQMAPEHFVPLKLAVSEAAGRLYLAEAEKALMPVKSTVLGKNVALVRAHRTELESVEEIFPPGTRIGDGVLNP